MASHWLTRFSLLLLSNPKLRRRLFLELSQNLQQRWLSRLGDRFRYFQNGIFAERTISIASSTNFGPT